MARYDALTRRLSLRSLGFFAIAAGTPPAWLCADDVRALLLNLIPEQTGGMTMEQFLDNLPPVQIDANGVVTASRGCACTDLYRRG